MELHDFQIDKHFYTATGKWRVIDVGTRTIIAIKDDELQHSIAEGCLAWDEQVHYGTVFTSVHFDGCDNTPFVDAVVKIDEHPMPTKEQQEYRIKTWGWSVDDYVWLGDRVGYVHKSVSKRKY